MPTGDVVRCGVSTPERSLTLPLLMARILLGASVLAALVGVLAFRQSHAPTVSHDSAREADRAGAIGSFLDRTPDDPEGALYRDSVALAYGLSSGEQSLLTRHGFVVTERIHPPSFGDGMLDIYVKDLPVFVSTDAVLHALHMSYDGILASTEVSVLAPLMDNALGALHGQVRPLATEYRQVDEMRQPVRDLDVYLTVARTLLGDPATPPGRESPAVAPVFSDNVETVQTLLGAIEAGGATDMPLFSEGCRQIDFSQFTPRGHYTEYESLSRYFQAMIWLGRTEIYLSAPQTDRCGPSPADVRRQAILAQLVTEAATRSGAREPLDRAEEMLSLFVGAPDNVTLDGLATLADQAGLGRASDLLDSATWARYQAAVEGADWARQRIRSQILDNSRGEEANRAQPAVAFLLVGQRFALDSFVLSRVVYDALEHDGQPVRRMLPSGLDVLYALGNDAAGQLLRPEFDRYPYASTLDDLRRLVDGTDEDEWQGSLYNGWLSAIRTLAPPPEADRADLPGFMQTGAWWQQKMNTQLASWAQLRHDNLLYAKPSYSASVGCSFPHSYVEPEPDLFRAVSQFARVAEAGFAPYVTDSEWDATTRTHAYFGRLASITDTLAVIAQKELDGVRTDDGERAFLSQMVFEAAEGCAMTLNGWLTDLYYGGATQAKETDLVVADIHPAPTDEAGNPVGWVFHAGTGPLDLAVVTAEVPGVGMVAFTGPVMSYRERLTTGFERLTDEAWGTPESLAASTRPLWTRAYLADASGQPYPAGPTLDD